MLTPRAHYRRWVPSDPTEPKPDGSHPSQNRPNNYLGRRIIALVIDWLWAYGISLGFFQGHPMVTLGIFAVATFVLQATLGTTIGHRIVGVWVRSEDGDIPGFRRAAIRTVLLCLIIPAVILDDEGRGWHEKISGTRVVRT